jgi:hypothetical protein
MIIIDYDVNESILCICYSNGYSATKRELLNKGDQRLF